jgi:hypothetical protein
MNLFFLSTLVLDIIVYVYYFVVAGVSFMNVDYARETPLFRSHVVTTLTLIRCTWLYRHEDWPWNFSALLFGFIFDVWNVLVAALAVPRDVNSTLWALLLVVPIAFCITSFIGLLCMFQQEERKKKKTYYN